MGIKHAKRNVACHINLSHLLWETTLHIWILISVA
jgi:hypothetical protein